VLDKIGYAIDGRMGFILLTGEVGTGKTTLCRTLLDRMGLKPKPST
jgi:type II secretory pathway predicted ATPase ExeA